MIMVSQEDLEYLKAYFVTRQECDGKTDEINSKLANDMTKLAPIEQKLNTLGWVSKTTLGAVITAIVGAILTLVLK